MYIRAHNPKSRSSANLPEPKFTYHQFYSALKETNGNVDGDDKLITKKNNK